MGDKSGKTLETWNELPEIFLKRSSLNTDRGYRWVMIIAINRSYRWVKIIAINRGYRWVKIIAINRGYRW